MAVTQKQSILIVEDSPEDFEATVRALRQAGLANPIVHCEDGEDALDYLFQRGRYAGAETRPRPGVILLDLDLPGTDGRAVLAELKQNRELALLPVIAFTVSTDPQDIEACYRAGANSYVKKPVSLEGLIQAISRLANHCFEIAVLPRPAKALVNAQPAPDNSTGP